MLQQWERKTNHAMASHICWCRKLMRKILM
uniref:Uncharacterized protein n=1 Tax=Musa acuminata subsp. malaccensis TaxID=214687 RepID=A0A804I7A2_MUSAM